MLLLAFAASPAFAQDGPELWGGAAVSVLGGAFSESGVVTDPVGTQVELNGAIGWGWGHARVDLDAHFDLVALADGDSAGVLPYPNRVLAEAEYWPEWAMVQLGREAPHLRLGILNPNIGLEDWEPWTNYVPSYSNNFVYAGAGRFLGVEPSITLDSGYDLFAFGGYDIDWASYGAGVGVATAQDGYGTWSGIVVYPSFTTCPSGDTCFNALAAISLEVYPADPLWVTLDTVTGIRGGGFYTSEQLVLSVIPEAVVNPFVRGEVVIDPDGVLGAPDATASLGARSDVTDFLRVALEGKSTFAGGATDVGAWLMIAAHVPEPSPYSYQDPFGEEEE